MDPIHTILLISTGFSVAVSTLALTAVFVMKANPSDGARVEDVMEQFGCTREEAKEIVRIHRP